MGLRATLSQAAHGSKTSSEENEGEAVLREFAHKCAICGGRNPHLHHIDGDPSNNEHKNLIPLCPNHHLIDQHAPTAVTDPRKLRLFRQFKDPSILSPEFEALFSRFLFLLELEKNSFDVKQATLSVGELTSFVSALKMGNFYAEQIGRLLKRPSRVSLVFPDPRAEEKGRRGRPSSNSSKRIEKRLLP